MMKIGELGGQSHGEQSTLAREYAGYDSGQAHARGWREPMMQERKPSVVSRGRTREGYHKVPSKAKRRGVSGIVSEPAKRRKEEDAQSVSHNPHFSEGKNPIREDTDMQLHGFDLSVGGHKGKYGKRKERQNPIGDPRALNSILKRLDALKDRQSSFDEEENTDPLHAEAKKRKKKIWDEARRKGIGMSWDDKLDESPLEKTSKEDHDTFISMYGDDAYINPDATDQEIHDWVDEQEKSNEHYKKWSKNFIDSFGKLVKAAPLPDEDEADDKYYKRWEDDEVAGKNISCPDCGRAFNPHDDEEWDEQDNIGKAHKSKYTSWNRMDSGVRNEHRNTLGLSSIGDFTSLSSSDQKKVRDAGFWKENLKQQPIKEGTHFGDAGSTPELEQEKKTPAPKAKPSTGKGYTRTRVGARRLKMASISTLLKIQSADLDTERVSHGGKPIKTIPQVSDNTRRSGALPIKKLPSSTGRDLSQTSMTAPDGYTGNQTTPDKPKQTGTLPKVETRAATQATGQGKTENISSTSGNTGTIGQQSQAREPDEEKGWNQITEKPIENKPKRGGGIRSKLGKLRDRARGLVGGNKKESSPWGKDGAKQDSKIGGHEEDTTSQSHQYHSGKKQSVHEPNIPKGGRAPHTRTDYDDPLTAPRHDEQEGDGEQNQSWSQAGNSSGQKGNKKQTQGRTRAGQRGNKKQTHTRTRAGERSNSAEENKKKLARTRAGSRKRKNPYKRTRAGERDD